MKYLFSLTILLSISISVYCKDNPKKTAALEPIVEKEAPFGISHGSFYLINSTTDQVIATISDGATYYLDEVGSYLNIQAVPTNSYDQVRFVTSDGFSLTEGVAPYAYRGDISGNYNDWTPALGSLAFTVEYRNGGTVIQTDTFTLNFQQTPPSSGDSPWTQSGSNIHYTAGNVGIGTNSPGSYKLAVNGNIRAKEVKVETGWADYVFEKGYALPSLEEVERHIHEKGHLINIPSATEVEANGIDLGDMNRLLLEKIEELTLYIIGQEKRIQSLEKHSNTTKEFKDQ